MSCVVFGRAKPKPDPRGFRSVEYKSEPQNREQAPESREPVLLLDRLDLMLRPEP